MALRPRLSPKVDGFPVRLAGTGAGDRGRVGDHFVLVCRFWFAPPPATGQTHRTPRRFQVGAGGFPTDIGRLLDAPQRPGVLGLLGPNGAGKTTLMSILATITRATLGKVSWNDIDLARHPDAIRSVLGYLPQDFGVYPNLNALEFLEYLAAVKGLDSATSRRRIEELLNLVNLSDVRKRPLGGYSGGMKQRIGIAQALLNDPQISDCGRAYGWPRSGGTRSLPQSALR